MSYSKPFRYTPDWYAGSYVESWIAQASTPEGLAALHEQQGRYKQRLVQWFDGIEMSGRVLELGFNDGKSVRWLAEMKPEIESFDLLDWSPSLTQVAGALSELVPTIRLVFQMDILQFALAEEYDHVLSLDFFEHLPAEVYAKSLPIVARALKPGGHAYVYFGNTRQPEHVNLRSTSQIKRDLTQYFDVIDTRGASGHKMFVVRKSSC